MIKEIKLSEKTIKYDLQRKDVKNINLRIKSDGIIHISANRWVLQKTIDKFILSKEEFIIKALEKFKSKSEVIRRQYYTEDEIRDCVCTLCEKVYPYFKNRGVAYPTIKFRRMVSQWGNCRAQKGILTFNINLMYAPFECIEYVVVHEFTHFLQANHSDKFYGELQKILPDWKTRRQKLKEISIRQYEKTN